MDSEDVKRQQSIRYPPPHITCMYPPPQAIKWVSNVNKAYENAGFTPVGMSGGGGGKLQRTLTDMERSDPNTAISQDGKVVPVYVYILHIDR